MTRTISNSPPLDFNKIQELIDQRYIHRTPHPHLPLFLLNYSAKCTYEKHWTPETMACRTLIVDDQNQPIARGLRKFFNYSELPAYPELKTQVDQHTLSGDPFEVQEKLDGSLIVIADYEGEMIVASRSQFESPHTEKAREILAARYPEFKPKPGYTYVFELIFPEGRIVVDYGKQEELVLLAVFHTETGEECWPAFTPFPRPSRYEFASVQEALESEQLANFEGYVIHFPTSGLRVKFKFDDYVRLHRLLTGLTPIHIWEVLKEGGSLDPVLDLVPDEFYDWVREIEHKLTEEFTEILACCLVRVVRAENKGFTERKQYAEYFKHYPYPSVCFRMLDGKSPDSLIWKLIKPKGGEAFWNKED